LIFKKSFGLHFGRPFWATFSQAHLVTLIATGEKISAAEVSSFHLKGLETARTAASVASARHVHETTFYPPPKKKILRSP
jgi:hypothetical protein